MVTRYCIVTKEEGIEYLLHSNNQFYWNVWYNGKKVQPLFYKTEKGALRRVAKVKSMYNTYDIKVREVKTNEFMKEQ